MILDEDLKQEITLQYLENVAEDAENYHKFINKYPDVRKLINDLKSGKHKVVITMFGKYTVAETIYTTNGYTHHFLGITAKNPEDESDIFYGIIVAVERSLYELLHVLTTKDDEEN